MNTKQSRKDGSNLPCKRAPSVITDFFGVKRKRGRPSGSKSRRNPKIAVAAQAAAVAASVPEGASRNLHNNFVIKKTSKTVHGETTTETSVPVMREEDGLFAMCVAAGIHEHNNSGSGAAASAATLSQRGVLPEVIVVDDEEDKDVKISAEGKEGKKTEKNTMEPSR